MAREIDQSMTGHVVGNLLTSVLGEAGGVFGGFVAALISIPCAAALVIIKEIWRSTALSPGSSFLYRPGQ